MLPACSFCVDGGPLIGTDHLRGPCIEHSPSPQRHLEKVAPSGPKVAGQWTCENLRLNVLIINRVPSTNLRIR